MYQKEELKYKTDIPAKEIIRMFAENVPKDRLRTTYVDMEKVRFHQSLPKNLYTGEAKKKREAELLEQFLREEAEQQKEHMNKKN